jgi:predicted AlkP superfamily pyrophosphatase or phosphodiesterase
LYDYAKEAGYKIGNVFWPVQACGKIDYNIPEIWPPHPDDDPRPVFKKAGSSPIMKTVFDKNRELWAWRIHPEVDIFITQCTVDIIKTYKPELVTVHLTNVDATRHSKGVFNNYVKKDIESTDEMLGRIFHALKTAGVYNETNIVILGDHGQLNVHKNVCINVLLERAGLIKLDDNGKIISYDAYCKSAGLSAHVILNEPDNKQLVDKVYELLTEWQKQPEYGIGEIFTKQEALEKHHLSGPFSFVLETDGCTSFGESAVGLVVRETHNNDYKFSRATHGHLPEKGPQPPFIVKGSAFKSGVVNENGNVVDVAPTIAKAMSISMKDTDGKVLYELLK